MEHIKFSIIQNSKIQNRYFIHLFYFDSYFEQDEIEVLSDDICYVLEIKYHEYVNIALKEFNGFLISNKTVCYNTEEDCQKAIDWLESRILMKKLEVEENAKRY